MGISLKINGQPVEMELNLGVKDGVTGLFDVLRGSVATVKDVAGGTTAHLKARGEKAREDALDNKIKKLRAKKTSTKK